MLCNSAVLKVASRCNLNCSYCYMYNMGDESFKLQPKLMSEGVVTALIQKVRNHLLKYESDRFSFIFHGGEPMLAPPSWYEFFDAEVQRILKPVGITADYYMQTNATLVDDEWCRVFGKLDIRPGFSMDGTRASHDTYRLDHAGRGSYESVVKGIQTYQRHFHSAAVILVLNVDEDPIEIYEHIKSLKINKLSVLLPDGHYENLPEGLHVDDELSQRGTRYGDWLIRLYDHWTSDPDIDSKPGITLFESLARMILGYEKNGNELYGKGVNDVLVVETNGSIETVDVLRICGESFTRNKSNVKTHELDDLFTSPLAQMYYHSHHKLCATCQSCPIESVCGGGYLPHRYSETNGFNNPSIYCRDIMKIITHMQNHIFSHFSEEALEDMNIHLLEEERVIEQIFQQLPLQLSRHSYQYLEAF
ncbi:MAG: radical SAM protein [Bacteroidota bacterium]